MNYSAKPPEQPPVLAFHGHRFPRELAYGEKAPRTTRLALRKTTARAAPTLNPGVLPGVDARLAVARRFHDLVATIVADQGGLDRMAEVRLQLVRRFSAAACLAEQLEARMATGQNIDIAEHAQLTSSMVRVATRIGLNRRTKEIVPTLRTYLEGKANGAADDDDDEAEP